MHKNLIKEEQINNLEKGPIFRSLFCDGRVLLFHHAVGYSGAKINIDFIAGSCFEREQEYGISHLIEHLSFKELETSLVKDLELLGAEMNAYTYKDNVCFELSCLGRKTQQCLKMFLDLIENFEFSEQQLIQEKKVIIQELKEDLDDHETQGLEYIFKKNFDKKIGHPVGGELKNINRFSKQDVNKYYKKYFKPERMIITIVSGIDEKNDLVSIVDERVKSQPPKDPYRIKLSKNLRKIDFFKTKFDRKMESAIYFRSFQGPQIDHPNYYDFIILDEFLFEGLSSIFFKKFREENAYVYGLGSSLNSFYNTGNYIMVFNSQNKNIDAIKKGIDETLSEFMTTKINLEQLRQIKDRLIEDWEISFDSLDERTEFISENEIYSQHKFDYAKFVEKINSVSEKSIKKVVEKFLLKEKSSELIYLSK